MGRWNTTRRKRPRSEASTFLLLIILCFIRRPLNGIISSLLLTGTCFTVQAWMGSSHILTTRTRILHRSRMEDSSDEETDDDDEDDEDDYDESRKENTLPPSFLFSSSHVPSFGLLRGRSAPAHRKAMSKSSSAKARIYSCSNCGAEFVNWVGKCHTCQRYNTVQEVWVKRDSSTSTTWPRLTQPPSMDHATSSNSLYESFTSSTLSSPPSLVPLDEIMTHTMDPSSYRWNIPKDSEMNAVLGGGLVPGSLILLGGDPGK
jgi:hypothetical protein